LVFLILYFATFASLLTPPLFLNSLCVQMHVHVALLDPALKAFLTSVPVDAPTWKYADCTGGQNLRCTASAQTTTVAAKCKSVNAGRGPSDASPFETIYSTYNSVATMSATTAVYSPRDNVFCVLQATDRSVSSAGVVLDLS
jgi:hypothetical protein